MICKEKDHINAPHKAEKKQSSQSNKYLIQSFYDKSPQVSSNVSPSYLKAESEGNQCPAQFC